MRRISNEVFKDVIWVADSREQVRSFPKATRTKIGEALRIAQGGSKHPKAKPLRSVGTGVLEIVASYSTNNVSLINSLDFHISS